MSPNDEIRRVWGIGTPRTLRPHWVLHELDLDYETAPILARSSAMDHPDFVALSRRGKIPLYEEGPLVIGESAAIALHLADRHHDRGRLTPAPGSEDRARHDELCFFVMTEMDAILYIIRRHEGLPEVYGASPLAADSARAYFLRSAGEIERRLADGRPHLLGASFQVADLLLKTCLDWAGFVGISLPETLARYSDTVGERPAYRSAIQHNFAPVAPAAQAALATERGDT